MAEKTNVQLTDLVDSLNTYVSNAQNNDLLFTSTVSRVGLKDGSGNDGDMFITDASLFFKRNAIWYNVACPSIFLGA